MTKSRIIGIILLILFFIAFFGILIAAAGWKIILFAFGSAIIIGGWLFLSIYLIYKDS